MATLGKILEYLFANEVTIQFLFASGTGLFIAGLISLIKKNKNWQIFILVLGILVLFLWAFLHGKYQ